MPSTKAALEQAEAERAVLLHTVQGQQRNFAKIDTSLPNAISWFKRLIDDLTNVTQRQVDRARSLLGALLGKESGLHPTTDGGGRYRKAEVGGTMRDYYGWLWAKISLVEGTGVEPATPTLRT